MSQQDPVIAAMHAGAGLPVLSILDEYLSERTQGPVDPDRDTEVLQEVIDEIQTWLDQAHARLHERLSACDPGPLRETLSDHLDTQVEARCQALDDVRTQALDGDRATAWSMLESEFVTLHNLRGQLHDLQRATRHLREVARLVTDIPDDQDGRAAMDELAQREALAASEPNPAAWAKAAKALEDLCLDHIRFQLDRQETPAVDQDEAEVELLEAEAAEEPPEKEAAPAPTPVTWQPEQETGNGHHATNGRNGHTKPPRSNGPHEARAQSPGQRRVGQVLERFRQERDESTPSKRMGKPAAGQDVLTDWRARLRTLTKDGQVPDGFRHGPLWAPIAEGTVVPATGTTDELLAFALDVEIDLIEIELPRILAMATGGRPAELHERLAERAKGITLKDPKQVARQVLLDHVVGKMPRRYRETPEGLALIESISYALARDEPWEASDHDYGEIVRNMVERELDRTPAVDLTDLASSLIGNQAEALEIVAEAADRIAASDDQVQLYPDGILVRALAEREDPDKLYKLRGALASRMGNERASELIKALITAGGEDA